MHNIEIVEASNDDFKDVVGLIKSLLVELEPSAKEEVENTALNDIAKDLLAKSKIWVFVAKKDDINIGLITLHECAAIYAGGVFGEVSELYVKPEFRSLKVGELLLSSAIEYGKLRGWKRLEVGSPSMSESPRTYKFYEKQGFQCTGSRLRFLI
ncbi:MAG: GNAT superfamily N-acetyltransferase [Paraglaciecola sp.]|jgi:GNAT superfamily N-acetyltransferase